jgi:hypothetical protein
MYVLLDDDRGALTLKRLWPWHQILVRGRATQLDRALAAGTSPEASASLAVRAAQLTSTGFRHDLAASLRRILMAAGEPAWPAARTVRVPLRTARVSQAASLLAELASRLLEAGPVPARGVAMVTLMLADGTGPLYREASGGDLAATAARASAALAWDYRPR